MHDRQLHDKQLIAGIMQGIPDIAEAYVGVEPHDAMLGAVRLVFLCQYIPGSESHRDWLERLKVGVDAAMENIDYTPCGGYDERRACLAYYPPRRPLPADDQQEVHGQGVVPLLPTQ